MNNFVWLQSPNYALTKSSMPLGYVYERGNPNIAAFTLRFKFASDVYASSSDVPPLPADTSRATTKGSWTKVQGVADNLWDYTYENPDWRYLFMSMESNRTDVTYGEFGDRWTTPCEIVDSGDLTGVLAMNSAFRTITYLTSVNIPSRVNITGSVDSAESPFLRHPHLKHVTINYVQGTATWFFRECSELETVNIGYFYDPHTSVTIFASYMCAYCYALTDFNVNFVKRPQELSWMFFHCDSLVHAPAIDTSDAQSMDYMFRFCTSLKDVPAYDLSSGPRTEFTFSDCTSLEYAPAFDTSALRNFRALFMNCTSLKRVPLYDTSSAMNMDSAFYNCTNVEGGALALYQQASSQATPPNTHKFCFGNCGINTVTGAAELAQIPSDWTGSGT